MHHTIVWAMCVHKVQTYALFCMEPIINGNLYLFVRAWVVD